MSYLQTLLGTSSSQAKNHIHTPSGFIKDAVDSMETIPAADASSPFKSGSYNDFVIEVHNDLCNMEKYLPPSTKFGVTFNRASDDFVLWTSEDVNGKYKFKIVLEDLHLKFKVLEVQDSILHHHIAQYRKKQKLKIKYTRNVLKTFTVPKGSIELKQHNLFFGDTLPNRVYLAFVEQEAFNNGVTKNPFYFVLIQGWYIL